MTISVLVEFGKSGGEMMEIQFELVVEVLDMGMAGGGGEGRRNFRYACSSLGGEKKKLR